MKEMVDRIIQEEDTARQQTDKARIDAGDIIFQAKKEARYLLEDNILEVKGAFNQRKEDSLKEFIAQKESILAVTREEVKALGHNRDKDIPKIAQDIFHKIIDISI